MSSNIANQVSYLRTSRDFPKDDIERLTLELSKAYLDTANAVNVRTIGIFTVHVPSVTGDTWYLTSKKQQAFRQVYSFTSTASIAHGINVSNISRFVSTYGNYTDGTNWYGLISGTNVAIAGQILFYITPTNIVFVVGAGAPALTSGTIVLQWISQP